MRARVPAPFGHVELECEDGALRRVHLSPEPAPETVPDGFPEHLVVPVKAYLEGRAPRPIGPDGVEGTSFQRTVWSALADIPPGSTLTYGQLAERLGKPGASRAVGQALRRNPLPLFWPCHRVTASDGSLGGFGGASNPDDPADAGQLGIKKWLLGHEYEMVLRRRSRD